MKRIKLTILKNTLLAASLVLSAYASADMTGTWSVTVETEMGTGTPSFDLVEDGGKLTGTYNGQMGSMPITGSVEDKTFKLVINIDAQGQSMAIEYTGSVDGDSIEGKLDFGGMGGGTFTGKKQ